MFLLCRYSFISGCSSCAFLAVGSVVWCWISFFSSFILISLSFSSFSFYLIISSFFSYSIFFCWSSTSIVWILSCQLRSVSFRRFYKMVSWSYSYWIIWLFMVFAGLGLEVFLALSLFSLIFTSISLILACLARKVSWFFRSNRSFSRSLSDRCLHYYRVCDSCSFNDLTLSSYSVSFRISFNALVCSLLILSKPSFSSCSTFNSFCKFLSSSSLPCTPRLS